MPVKARRDKRRPGLNPDAFTTVFESGFDFFHALGLSSDEQAREAAREAWPALGPAFLAERADRLAQPGAIRPSREVPWAVEAFGPPPGWRQPCP